MSVSNLGMKAFPAGGTINQYARVKFSGTADQVVESGLGATDAFIGWAMPPLSGATYASGDIVNILLKNSGGSVKAIASEAFAIDAALYGAAAGKVADTVSGGQIAIALEAAAADGDIVEILPV